MGLDLQTVLRLLTALLNLVVAVLTGSSRQEALPPDPGLAPGFLLRNA
jgi:hypothetical protein